jgi:hypothetical protein
VLTSVHIPIVLDWKPLRALKGGYYVDGYISGVTPVKDESTVVIQV